MMREEEFDNYKFSVNTEIKIYSDWIKVVEIDFEKRIINNRYHHLEIMGIR